MPLEFDVKDLKHIKNYLVFAHRYMIDRRELETNKDMLELINEELSLIGGYIKTINNFISIWG